MGASQAQAMMRLVFLVFALVACSTANQGAYRVGPANTNGCGPGATAILTKEDCASAASVDASWAPTGSSGAWRAEGVFEQYPGGCFWDASSNSVFWNTHATGAGHSVARKLCRVLDSGIPNTAAHARRLLSGASRCGTCENWHDCMAVCGSGCGNNHCVAGTTIGTYTNQELLCYPGYSTKVGGGTAAQAIASKAACGLDGTNNAPGTTFLSSRRHGSIYTNFNSMHGRHTSDISAVSAITSGGNGYN